MNGGPGKDTITIGGTVAGSAYGRAGADDIRVSATIRFPLVMGQTAVTGTVRGGAPLLGAVLDGNDTITINGGDAMAVGGDAVTGTVIGDAGDDRITLAGGGIEENTGAAGHGVDQGGSVQGGAGQEEIKVYGGKDDSVGSTPQTAVGTGEVRGGGTLGGLLYESDNIIIESGDAFGDISGDGDDDCIRVPINSGRVLGGAGGDTLRFLETPEPPTEVRATTGSMWTARTVGPSTARRARTGARSARATRRRTASSDPTAASAVR
ncbi:hypothetical protein ABT354_13255 [Streptomyces sp. NPDC000594]|uniref:hypothetical protein n=1 Tax=Streptomyces sp. NPDC000594 TaxID=3154261 RepID=UPI00332967AA